MITEPTMDDDLNKLLKESDMLRALMVQDCSQTSVELVKEAVLRRKRFRVRVQEAKHVLARKKGELQAWINAIDIAYRLQGTDIDELDDVKWDLIKGRTAMEKGDDTHPDVQ